MLERLNGKHKRVRKSKLRQYSLDYILELPSDTSLDEFVEKLVELVESFEGYLGGGAAPYLVEKNGKKKEEKRHQQPAK